MPMQPPQYPDLYPRGTSTGTIAILCEGDVNGYEAALLEQWADSEHPHGFRVDVWPCGTGDALGGMADAIGRSVLIVVLEDRDFRTMDKARADCAKKCVEREARKIAIRGWTSWSRNEIENYFLDHEVLHPCMTEAFGCSSDDVDEALDNAVKSLVVFQSVKAAAGAASDDWVALDDSRYPGGGKPKWKPEGLVVPDAAAVRRDLEGKLKGLSKKVLKDGGKVKEPFAGERLLAEFDKRLIEWQHVDLETGPWKTDWAGKEILKLVRQQLAARFPAPI